MTRFGAAPRPGAADFTRIEPGFADPVHGAQTCFRAILDATAHPGRIVTLPAVLGGRPPASLGAAGCAVALTLCDFETPVWLDEPAQVVAPYLTFHCGAPLALQPAEARFAFCADPLVLPPLEIFALGTDEYPERSTTLIVEVAGLEGADALRLTGPGIAGETGLAVAGLPVRFWSERAALGELFPRGLDVLFVCGDRLVAVPRSTKVDF